MDEEHFKHAEKLQTVIFTHDHHFIEIADALNRKGKDQAIKGNKGGQVFILAKERMMC